MLNVTLIEELKEKYKLSNSKIGEILGITGPGFKYILDNKDTKVSILFRLSELFDVPVTSLIEKKSFENKTLLNEAEAKYGVKENGIAIFNSILKVLEKQLNDQDAYIRELLSKIPNAK